MLSPSLKFTELTNGYNADDNVVFHLKKLTELGYIKKEENLYLLTTDGVRKTNDYDWKSLVELGSKPLFVGFIAKYADKYLIKKHDHAKDQFYNLPNGKPYYDKEIRKELVRIAKSEMNLETKEDDFAFDSVHIKHIVTSIGEVMFSDVFVVYSVQIFEIDELPSNIVLMKKGEVEKLRNKWKEIDFCILREGWKPYLEYRFESNYIL